jgi:hypothetical protein
MLVTKKRKKNTAEREIFLSVYTGSGNRSRKSMKGSKKALKDEFMLYKTIISSLDKPLSKRVREKLSKKIPFYNPGI